VQIFSIGCFVFALLQNLSDARAGGYVAFLTGLLLLIVGTVLARRFHFGRELSVRATVIGLFTPYFLGGLKVFYGGFLFALIAWFGRDLWESDAGKELKNGKRKINPFHLIGFLSMECYYLFLAGCESMIWDSNYDFEFAAKIWPVFGALTTILIVASLVCRRSHRRDRSLDGIASGLMIFGGNIYLMDPILRFLFY